MKVEYQRETLEGEVYGFSCSKCNLKVVIPDSLEKTGSQKDLADYLERVERRHEILVPDAIIERGEAKIEAFLKSFCDHHKATNHREGEIPKLRPQSKIGKTF